MSRVIISDQGTQPSQPRRDVCIVTDGDGKHRLCVDAALTVTDINIGAVEIKDGDSGTRVDVEEVYDYNAIMVYDAIEYQKTKVNVFGTAMVASGASVVLSSFTVPASKLFNFTSAVVGGAGSGKFELVVNGSTVMVLRNAGADRTKEHKFIETPEANATEVVEIKVTNCSNVSADFEATLSGYTVNA